MSAPGGSASAMTRGAPAPPSCGNGSPRSDTPQIPESRPVPRPARAGHVMNDKAPATARRARIARRLRVDRNPLRRPVDRLQAGIMAGLLAAFLAAAPLAAAAASGWAHAAGLREQHAQRSWHQVPAVLLQAAPPQAAL